jgi:hypothetical protein
VNRALAGAGARSHFWPPANIKDPRKADFPRPISKVSMFSGAKLNMDITQFDLFAVLAYLLSLLSSRRS